MKKIIICLAMLVGLSGCLYQDVPKFIIDKSEDVCKDHGGTWEITSYFDGHYNAICGDGFVQKGLQEQ